MIRFKKVLLVLALCVQALNTLNAQNMPIEKVREHYFTMDKSEDGALKLYKILEKSDLEKDPVMMAYRGASSAAAAGSVSGVRQKLEYFNRGKTELEKSVGLKPLDAEIRFLRLATQSNAPAFLGYTGNKKNDKEIIINTLKSVPSNHPNAYLYQRICSFMLHHTELSPAEKTTVNQLLTKFNSKK